MAPRSLIRGAQIVDEDILSDAEHDALVHENLVTSGTLNFQDGTISGTGDMYTGDSIVNGKLTVEMDTGGTYDSTTVAAIFGDSDDADSLCIIGNTLNGDYGANANGSIWVNYRGYQGGTTQFRDFTIGDGKGTTIAFFDGSTGRMGIGNNTTLSAQLHLKQSINGPNTILIENTSTAATAYSAYRVETADSGIGYFLIADPGFASVDSANRVEIFSDTNCLGVSLTADSAAGDIRFYTGGRANERARITSSGTMQLFGDLLVDGGDIGITGDTDLIGLASGLLKVRGDMGIGTDTVPHGGVGAARLAIEGVNANWADGPNIQITTDLDDYPLLQILAYAHDNINITFDGYYPGYKSSDSGSTFQIQKGADALSFKYGVAAAGTTVTLTDGFIMSKTGVVTLSQDLRVDGGNIGITADTDLIQLAADELTVNGKLIVEKDTGGVYDSTTVAAIFGDSDSDDNCYIIGGTLNAGYNYTGDDYGMRINYRGHQGGTAYFRDFYVDNGKGATIAFFDGSTGKFIIGSTTIPETYLHIEQSVNGEVSGYAENQNTGASTFATWKIKTADSGMGYLMIADPANGSPDAANRVEILADSSCLGVSLAADSPTGNIKFFTEGRTVERGVMTGAAFTYDAGKFISLNTGTSAVAVTFEDSGYLYFAKQPVANKGTNTNLSELVRIDNAGKVGIGTGAIPHSGVGAAKLAIEGTDSNIAGPHVQFTTATNDSPLMQILPWSHDSINIYFDAYYDGTNHRSSDAGSSFQIRKGGDTFLIQYDVAAAGAVVSWNPGFSMSNTGVVTLNNKLIVEKDTGGTYDSTTVAAIFGDSDGDDNLYIIGNTINSAYNYNDDTNFPIVLNYRGYQGGITKFRNVWICDGKGNIIATFDGSSRNFSFYQGTGIDEFSTDGTLAGDSDNAVPTEQAVKTYVDTISGSLQQQVNAKPDSEHIHDNRYYTETEVDALITTISGKLDDHNELNNLDYVSSGHTGFAPTIHVHTTISGGNTHVQVTDEDTGRINFKVDDVSVIDVTSSGTDFTFPSTVPVPAVSGTRLSTVDGTAFAWIHGTDLTNYIGKEIVFRDSTGKEVVGYIKEPDAGEALAGEKISNPDFETYTGTQDDGASDTFTNWTVSNINDGNGDKVEATATVQSGSNAIKITKTTGATPKVYSNPAIPVTAGKLYKFAFYTRGDGSISGSYLIWDVTNARSIRALSTGITSTTYTLYTTYFTAPPGCTAINIHFQFTLVGIVYYDNSSLKEVTHVGADGVHIVSALGGLTRNWTSIDSGFNGNNISSIEILDSSVSIDKDGLTITGETSTDSLNVSGLSVFDDYVGIGTGTIPHGGVGAAKLAIEGANGSSAGPHIQLTTASDDYPLMQILPWSHDNIALHFDMYFDGTNWRSSDPGSSFLLYKNADTFKIQYGVAAAGAVVATNTGFSMNSSGVVTLSQDLRVDGGDIGITTDTDLIRLAADELTVNGVIKAGADTDVTHELGRLKLGYRGDAPAADYGIIAHYDHMNSTNYAFAQGAAGDTYLNAAAGQLLTFGINNSTFMTFANTGLKFASGARISQFDDDNTLAANSATRAVTQAAVKGYVDTEITTASGDIVSQIPTSHTELSDIGTNSHSDIDTHISNFTENTQDVIGTSLSGINIDVTYDDGTGITTLLGGVGGGGLFTEDANSNVIGGTDAGSELSAGLYNFYGGYNAGRYGDGSYNVAVGFEALKGVTGNDFNRNVAIGYQAGISITTGSDNIMIGHTAGHDTAAATKSIFIGRDAGFYNNAARNVCVGMDAGFRNVTGPSNVYVGYQCGMGVIANSNSYNVGLGDKCLWKITVGAYNVSIGYQSLYNMSSPSQNTGIGAYAGHSLTTGANITIIGSEAGRYNQTGGNNTIIGFQAGLGVVSNSNSDNTFIGYLAGTAVTTGSTNVCVGSQTGDNITSGASNIVIGYDIDPDNAAGDNQFMVGNATYPFLKGDMANYILAINGANGYLNFNTTTGSGGYGIRDNAGSIEYKDSGDSWTAFSSANPVGSIISVALSAAPAGYLECDGAAISRTTYSGLWTAISGTYGDGDESTTFNIPDYRGKFLRSWDHGAGNDPDAGTRTDRGDGVDGDNVGTKQADEFESHVHTEQTVGLATATYGTTELANTGGSNTGAAGGNETRPINVNVLTCIKY